MYWYQKNPAVDSWITVMLHTEIQILCFSFFCQSTEILSAIVKLKLIRSQMSVLKFFGPKSLSYFSILSHEEVA